MTSPSSHQNTTPPQAPEAGNVIWFVLIAVVLFAALSFTVAQMLRSGSPEDISAEKTKLYAAEILDTARQFRGAVQNAIIGNNCDESQISFANNTVPGYEHSPASPALCQIFHGSEGTASYRPPPQDWLDTAQSARDGYAEWFFIGEGCVHESGSSDDNCSNSASGTDSDLIAVVPWIKRQICVELNDKLGIENPEGDPPQAGGEILFAPITKFTGSYTENYAIQSDSSDAQILTATPTGCFEGGGTPTAGSYHFYQVLVAR